MRLTSVKVEGLFGLFDHEVQLNQEERITIATGPNGVGKTTLLRLISSFFGSDFQEIVRVSFGQALFAFDNGLTVSVEREVSDGEEGGPEEETLPKLIFRNGENEWKYEVTTRRVSPAWIERDMPWMERIEGGFWRDRTDGEVIPHRTMIRRYGRGPRGGPRGLQIGFVRSPHRSAVALFKLRDFWT